MEVPKDFEYLKIAYVYAPFVSFFLFLLLLCTRFAFITSRVSTVSQTIVASGAELGSAATDIPSALKGLGGPRALQQQSDE